MDVETSSQSYQTFSSSFLKEKYKSFHLLWTDVPFSSLLNISKVNQFLLCRRYSMNNWPSLSTLYELARKIKDEKIQGAFVECGCCNGGAGAMTVPFLSDREYWLFDSFEGLPQPTKEDIKAEDNSAATDHWRKGWDKGDIERVQELYLSSLHFPSKRLHLVKGLFHETVPKTKNKIKQIALLHLDGDWYESTKVCIENLFDHVVPGGFIVVDDYGHWKGCKKAIDAFLQERKITPHIHRVDYTRIYFRKE